MSGLEGRQVTPTAKAPLDGGLKDEQHENSIERWTFLFSIPSAATAEAGLRPLGTGLRRWPSTRRLTEGCLGSESLRCNGRSRAGTSGNAQSWRATGPKRSLST